MSNRVVVKKVAVKKKAEPTKHFPVVAIGASSGGLEAMSELLKYLPSTTGMAYIFVQHLSPNHKSLLSEILAKVTKMKVQEIDQMELIKPNNIYVIPPNKGIEVTDGHIKLVRRARGSSSISIDILFSSLAETHRNQVIGIILSGNARDGQNGLKAIKRAGGITFAQDSSAHASSMPEAAISSGAVDYIMSPKNMALELSLLSKDKFVEFNKRLKKNSIDYSRTDLGKLFEYLKIERGLDFNFYKLPTIKRRLKYRMSKCNTNSISSYLTLIKKNVGEIDELYNSLLINVTTFFRDTAVFKYLRTQTLPSIIKSKKEGEEIRIWVPACSTGQEAYTLAMIMTELIEKSKKKVTVKIFATDISEYAIQKSRTAEYKKSELKEVSKSNLNRYFIKKGESYQVVKDLRDMCVFAVHNILRDPPFSRMDFITCRNMLIYFEPVAQKQVFDSLHFALREGGLMVLGKVESVGSSSTLFTELNKTYKVFSKKKNHAPKRSFDLAPFFKTTTVPIEKGSLSLKRKSMSVQSIDTVVDHLLLTEYVPACVLINQDMEILQSKGAISSFLKLANGKASLNILKMTRPEFGFELRSLIFKAIKTNKNTSKKGIEIKIEGVLQKIDIDVRLIEIKLTEPLYLVVFNLQEKVQKVAGQKMATKSSEGFKAKIKDLHLELTSIRAEMNLLIETQEEVFAELQSSNEENVSANEEFQTLNEELETSKEEVEASNEELVSANRELRKKNDLLTEFQDYSEAITATIHEPMLVMYTDFKVKSANRSFYEKFQLKREDTEGKNFFELDKGQWNISDLKKALSNLVAKNSDFKNLELKQRLANNDEKILLLNAHFVNQKTNKKKLILLAIEDITELSNYYTIENSERKREEQKFRGFLESAPDAIVIVDEHGDIQLINSQTEKLFGYNRSEIIGRDVEILLPARFKTAHLQHRNMFTGTEKSRAMGLGVELFAKRKDGHEFPVEISLSQLETQDGKLISTAIRDITKQKSIEAELVESKQVAERAKKIAEDAMQAKQQFLSTMSHEIRTPMNAIIGFTNVVLRTELSARQKEYMNAIKTSGDVLIVLINDILDLAKVDAGKMEFEQIPFELSACMASILNIFETDIQEKKLRLVKVYDKNIPTVLIGDSIRLNQILLNLVSNAVKFTTVGEIRVSVRVLAEDTNHLTLEFAVSDTGIGIAAEKMDTIFEKFQQATAGTSRLYGGTGLGLAIVKQLVEKQGGTISIESKIGKGSSFIFTLTFLKTNKQMAAESEHIQLNEAVNKIRVLVVEDVPLNQLLMKTVLSDFGFEYELAENGKIAIEKMEHSRFDIVLMDLQMPVMNGFEATNYIRDTLKSKTPILALTAEVTSIDADKCRAAGMNDYISKPIDEKLLYAKMIGLVNEHLDGGRTTNSELKKAFYTGGEFQTQHRPEDLKEIYTIFLKQTPPSVLAMTEGAEQKDWKTVHAALHKLLPSISIMGIEQKVGEIARSILLGYREKEDINKHLVHITYLKHAFTECCEEISKKLTDLA